MIGILDSGNGGLSVLNEVCKLLPQESILYVGDTAWCPYGEKSYAQILERVDKLIHFLIRQGATLIVIACNSATIACITQLRERFTIPIVGMEPGIKPAVQQSQTKRIGIFATKASLTGEKFHKLISTHASKATVYTQACPKFVTLVEQGILSGSETHEAIHLYAKPMIENKVDTIVLGCSHYPFLKGEIHRLYPHITLIDTGEAIAKQVKRLYAPSLSPQEQKKISFFTSGNPINKPNLLRTLCPQISSPHIEHISI